MSHEKAGVLMFLRLVKLRAENCLPSLLQRVRPLVKLRTNTDRFLNVYLYRVRALYLTI